jgi:hypothetical protein
MSPADDRSLVAALRGMRRSRLRWAVLLALVVSGAAAAAAGTYYLAYRGHAEQDLHRTFVVELAPVRQGLYDVYLPVPVDRHGDPVPLRLSVEAGNVEFGLLRTEFGAALRVQGEGPARLRQEGGLPLRLSLDDTARSFPQFRFRAYLADGSPQVLATVTLAERNDTADWDRRLDTGRSIVVQDSLSAGWTSIRATHYFDLTMGKGYAATFPRVALLALDASLAAMYVPLAMIVLRARAQPGLAGTRGLK